MADELKEKEVISLGIQTHKKIYEEEVISTLPLCQEAPFPLRNYHGCWYPEAGFPGLMALTDHFHPRPTDIHLISSPKSGTTWLKTLAFAIVNRKEHHPSNLNHPLLAMNPHDCVPFIETIFASGVENHSKLDALLSTRILATHMPYQLLPKPITSSECRFIYICRDPKDTFVSGWHFWNEFSRETKDPVPLSEAFETFCMGTSPYGPLWDHYLGYWSESLRRPDKVLFLNYEEMMEKPVENVKRMAEFVGLPFSQAEEEEGLVEAIVSLCSFDKMSNTEMNKKGTYAVKGFNIKISSYFRKGKVGDWKNYLTTEMAERLDVIMEGKLRGSGLRIGAVTF